MFEQKNIQTTVWWNVRGKTHVLYSLSFAFLNIFTALFFLFFEAYTVLRRLTISTVIFYFFYQILGKNEGKDDVTIKAKITFEVLQATTDADLSFGSTHNVELRVAAVSCLCWIYVYLQSVLDCCLRLPCSTFWLCLDILIISRPLYLVQCLFMCHISAFL